MPLRGRQRRLYAALSRTTLLSIRDHAALAEFCLRFGRLLLNMLQDMGKVVHLALLREGAPPLVKAIAAEATALKHAQSAQMALRLLATLTYGYEDVRSTREPNINICFLEGCRHVAAAGGIGVALDCLQAWTSKQLINKIDHESLTVDCFTILWHLQKALGQTAVQE